MMDKNEFDIRCAEYRMAVETYLNGLFAQDRPYGKLYESMRYSLLSGGKRIRPILVLEFARLGGLADYNRALPFAAAVEMVHTYSLIHDDLPCMDDDKLRRGKPTNHVVFGETMAVLAGDALQAEAFRSIAGAGLSWMARAKGTEILSRACGADGMVAGQVLDTANAPAQTEKSLALLHALKTGAMICGACELGCAAADADEALFEAARGYASEIGLAFQIRDDMLDVIGDAQVFGKPIGSDSEEGKVTFVDLLGMDGCEKRIRDCTERAKDYLAPFDDTEFLSMLADDLALRMK